MIGKLTRARLYPAFVPDPSIKKFTVFAWKVMAVNAGSGEPGQQLMLQRCVDKKVKYASFMDIGKDLFLAPDCVLLAAKNGYRLVDTATDNDNFSTKLVFSKT